MNRSTFVATLALVAAASAALVWSLARGADGVARADERALALEARLAQMEESLARLSEHVERNQARLEQASGPALRLAQASPDVAMDAVSAAADDVAATGADDDLTAADQTAAAPEGALDLQELMLRLRSGELDDEEKFGLWQKIAAAGQLDEALALVEEAIQLDPTNPDLRVHLGSAYLQKVFTVPEYAKGTWAIKADGAYDQALELDPKHWEARFSKAISLSFWPAITGKQPEAIRQFETLIEQQEARGGAEEGYDQTYLFLGNLYQQTGKTEQAKAIWQKGSALFPQNAELKAALAGS